MTIERMTDDQLRDELYNRLTRRFELAKLQHPTLTIVTHKPSVFVTRRFGHELIFSKGAEQKLIVGEIRWHQTPDGNRPQPLSIRRGWDPTRLALTLAATVEGSMGEVIDNIVSTFLRESET